MTDVASDIEAGEAVVSGAGAVDEGLVAELVARAQAGGVNLTGEGGLLQQLTKQVWSPLWRANSPNTAAAKSRTLSFQYHFTDMAKTGNVRTSALMITTTPKIPKKWPAAAKVTQGGNVPGAKSFDDLSRTKTFAHTVTVAAGQGTGREDKVFAVYEPQIGIKPPPGYTLNGAGGKKQEFTWPSRDVLEQPRYLCPVEL
jgi:hypothetical protein